MKKKVLIEFFIIFVVFYIFTFYMVKDNINDNEIEENDFKDKNELNFKIGYCPTMYLDALEYREKNGGKLVALSSANYVLNALNNGEIEKGIIGRKSYSFEINNDINEVVIKSGYTLVSNEKKFLLIKDLDKINVFTYLSKEDIFEWNNDEIKINYGYSIKEIDEKINSGEIVLISWDDFKEDYELVVVMDGNEKVKKFRGVFLYE